MYSVLTLRIREHNMIWTGCVIVDTDTSVSEPDCEKSGSSSNLYTVKWLIW